MPIVSGLFCARGEIMSKQHGWKGAVMGIPHSANCPGPLRLGASRTHYSLAIFSPLSTESAAKKVIFIFHPLCVPFCYWRVNTDSCLYCLLCTSVCDREACTQRSDYWCYRDILLRMLLRLSCLFRTVCLSLQMTSLVRRCWHAAR